MESAKDVFENWYNAIYENEKGDEDIKEMFREAFEAGMVSGIAFIQEGINNYANVLTKDYKGFQDVDQ
jgi:hypothetical protein